MKTTIDKMLAFLLTLVLIQGLLPAGVLADNEPPAPAIEGELFAQTAETEAAESELLAQATEGEATEGEPPASAVEGELFAQSAEGEAVESEPSAPAAESEPPTPATEGEPSAQVAGSDAGGEAVRGQKVKTKMVLIPNLDVVDPSESVQLGFAPTTDEDELLPGNTVQPSQLTVPAQGTLTLEDPDLNLYYLEIPASALGLGTHALQVSWAGDEAYEGCSETVTVTVTSKRAFGFTDFAADLAAPGEPYTISARLVDEGGAPAQEGTEVTVSIQQEPGSESMLPFFVRTDGDGRLSFTMDQNLSFIHEGDTLDVGLSVDATDEYLGAELKRQLRFSSTPTATHTVTVAADPTAGGTVAGGGTVNEGESTTVTATANEGYAFVGWYDGETKVSDDASYTFTPTGDVTLTAKYKSKLETLTTAWDGRNAVVDQDATFNVTFGLASRGSTLYSEMDKVVLTLKGNQIGERDKHDANLFHVKASDLELGDNYLKLTYPGSDSYLPSSDTFRVRVVQKHALSLVDVSPETAPLGTPYTVSGRIVDEDGSPVVGKSLYAYVQDAEGASTSSGYSATTGDDGAFSFDVSDNVPTSPSTINVRFTVSEGDDYKALAETRTISFVQTHTVTLAANPSSLGFSLEGGDSYPAGTEITVKAEKYINGIDGFFAFEGWYADDTMVSGDVAYTFTVIGDTSLTAKFKKMVFITYSLLSDTVDLGEGIEIGDIQLENAGKRLPHEEHEKITLTRNGNPVGQWWNRTNPMLAVDPTELGVGTHTLTLSYPGSDEYFAASTDISVTVVKKLALSLKDFAPTVTLVNTPYTVSGRIVDEDGNPYSGKPVTLSVQNGENSAGFTTLGSVMTDQNGAFSKEISEALPTAPGTRQIRVRADGDDTCKSFDEHPAVTFVDQLPTHAVTVAADPTAGGTVAGGGQVIQGESTTVTATATEGYEFAGWYDGETKVSDEASYTFTPTDDVTLTAKFAQVAKYNLWVGGTQVDETNKDDIPGVTGENAKASFDPATNTLTLENVTGVTGSTMGALVTAEGIDLTIKGDAVLADASVDTGIQVAPGSLTLDGDFTISAGSYGIYVQKDVTVAKGSLFAEGWAYGIYSARDAISVNGSELEALGSIGALGTNPVLSGYDPDPGVLVNTEAEANGAVAWNGTDSLGGFDSPYKYVKVSPKAYSVTVAVDPADGGTASVLVQKPGQLFNPQPAEQAEAGDEVRVRVAPNDGYGISSVTAVTRSGQELSLTKMGAVSGDINLPGSIYLPVDPSNPATKPQTDYVFTMPAEAVDVTVRFGATYPITLTQTGHSLYAYATVPSSGVEGETITVRLQTNDAVIGASLKSVVVTGADGTDVPVTKNGNDFEFTMPAQAVGVKAEVVQPRSMLTSITAEGGTLEPAFNPEVTAYTITVPYETEEIGLIAEQGDYLMIIENEWKSGSLRLTYNPTYPDCIIKADGRIALDVGENVVHLTASKTNGPLVNTEYTVTITRQPQASDSYTVTFKDDTNILSNVTVNSGEKVARPSADPSKEGYKFDGWYADPNFETPFDFDQEITEHTSVYAKFSLMTYPITLVADPADGGTATVSLAGMIIPTVVTKAQAGQSILITPKAAPGYQVASISCQTSSGTAVTVDEYDIFGISDPEALGSGTFVMPAEAVTVTVTFTPNGIPAESKLTLTTDDDQYVYSEPVTVSGKLTDGQGNAMADKAIALSVNGKAIDVDPSVKTDGNGEYSHTFTPDAPGTYTVKAEFAGIPGSIAGSAAEASFEVLKIKTVLGIDAQVDKSSLVVSVKRTAGATGGIRVVVDDKEYSVEDFTTGEDGDLFTLTIDNITPGEHTIRASYAGDEHYTEANPSLVLIEVPLCYTVRFDPNPPHGWNVTGSMNDQDREFDDKLQLTKCAFTIDGEDAPAFTGWNTKADGSGDSYANEDRRNITDEHGAVVTLYAIWNNPQITTNHLPEGTVGEDYSAALSQVGLSQPKWAISKGELPEGLSLDPDTGVISGTPKKACTVSIEVEATEIDPTGTPTTVTKDLTITIATNVTGITLNSDDAKKDYDVGDALDVSGLTLTVSKSDGSTETVPVTEDMVSGFDSSKTGKQTLTVTYEGFTDTYEVEIKAPKPKYAVTVEADPAAGGTVTGGGQVTEGESATVTATASEGYEFVGWYEGENKVSGEASYTLTPTDDVALVARFAAPSPAKPATHTVTFDANGHGAAPAAQTVEDGKTATRPADPEEAGWSFGGWYTEPACESEFDFATPIDGDVTLYAKWEKDEAPSPAKPATHTVTFDANGHGTAPAAQTVEGGKTATRPADPEEAGWAFGGWYAEAACESEFDFTTPIDGDVTLYAKWTSAQTSLPAPANMRTITYDLNGGTLDGKTGTVTVQAQEGSTITLPAPTREGYAFDYWKGSRYDAGDTYTVKGDHTFTAQWKKDGTPATGGSGGTSGTSGGTTTRGGGTTGGSGGTTTRASGGGSAPARATPSTGDAGGPAPWLASLLGAALVLLGVRRRAPQEGRQ